MWNNGLTLDGREFKSPGDKVPFSAVGLGLPHLQGGGYEPDHHAPVHSNVTHTHTHTHAHKHTQTHTNTSTHAHTEAWLRWGRGWL